MRSRRRSPQADGLFICKIQVSVYTSEDCTQVLAYNEDRSIQGQFDATPDLIEAMKGRYKAFFYCRLRDSQLAIDREAPWQDW
jgi:hypothetical protein